MRRKHRTTAAKVTAELNQHLNSPVSSKTVDKLSDLVMVHNDITTNYPDTHRYCFRFFYDGKMPIKRICGICVCSKIN